MPLYRSEEPDQFVIPKQEISETNGNKQIRYSRVDSIKGAWSTVRENAGIFDLQIKYFRTYFSHKLQSSYGFSTKEAGVYIGNSKGVKYMHYSPISLTVMKGKLKAYRISDLIGKPKN